MYSYLTIKNISAGSVISVSADGLIASEQILLGEKSRRLKSRCGSCHVQIFDNREKKLYDIWLTLVPDMENILELYDEHFSFISLRNS